jgi:hypothetical protein
MVEMCEVEPACAWWLRQLELYISAQLVVYSPTNFCTSFEGDSVRSGYVISRFTRRYPSPTCFGWPYESVRVSLQHHLRAGLDEYKWQKLYAPIVSWLQIIGS